MSQENIQESTPENTPETSQKKYKDHFIRLFPKIDAWDKQLLSKIYHNASEGLQKLAISISFMGDPRLWGVVLVALGIYGIVVLDFTLVAIFLCAFLLTYSLYYVFKHYFGRGRPFVQMEDIKRRDKTGHGFSFPSGHCHHSTVLMGMIWLSFFPNLWFLLILIVYNIFVALSRLVSGCHYPSDTIFAFIEAYIMLFFYWFVVKDIVVDVYLFFAQLFI
jgi:undecaprenyl-diphosphatase